MTCLTARVKISKDTLGKKFRPDGQALEQIQVESQGLLVNLREIPFRG